MSNRPNPADALGVPPGSPVSEVRAAFLKRLESDDFIPPPDIVWAAISCGESDVPRFADVRQEEAAARHHALDEFAKQYWSLPPAERTKRWKELEPLASAEASTKARHADLELGLGVEVKRHENALVEEVCEAIRSLYVLPPRASALKRCEWLVENAERKEDLQHAGRRLRTDEPQLSRLVPPLLVELARPRTFLPVSGIDPAVVEAEREALARRQAHEAEVEARRQRRKSEKLVRRRSGTPASEGSGCGGWSTYVVIAIILFGVRVCVSSNRTPTLPTPASYKLNEFKLNDSTRPWNQQSSLPKFTEKEVGYFKDYEDTIKSGKFTFEPPWYREWKAAGRPGDTWTKKRAGP